MMFRILSVFAIFALGSFLLSVHAEPSTLAPANMLLLAVMGMMTLATGTFVIRSQF